ncbi:Serine/threonine-protein kinase PLK [Trichostrongylus colubriformis]|uniref:polo kinase n=1 Tax=Trichostrongylus colubriformis TaxID=6319 RepID=A0AAN8G5F2_TRICO
MAGNNLVLSPLQLPLVQLPFGLYFVPNTSIYDGFAAFKPISGEMRSKRIDYYARTEVLLACATERAERIVANCSQPALLTTGRVVNLPRRMNNRRCNFKNIDETGKARIPIRGRFPVENQDLRREIARNWIRNHFPMLEGSLGAIQNQRERARAVLKGASETYSRIKMNQYRVPSNAGHTVSHLIQNLLAADPAKRPTVKQVLAHDFFRSGYMPTRLPISCLTMAPKFNRHSEIGLPATTDKRGVPAGVLSPKQLVKQDLMTGHARALNAVPENKAIDGERIDRGLGVAKVPEDGYLSELYEQISSLCNARVADRELRVEDEAPEAMPIFWISKWVDYSDKYGIGYQLCDNSVGVLFNDSSKLVLDEAGNELTYIEKNETENYYGIESYPESLSKKVTLLKYFRAYMNEHLIKAGAHVVKKDGDDLARLPVLRYWFRTRSAIVLHLSNGTLQINFFEDHTKAIVCPLMGAITYIDEHRNFRVYKLSHLQNHGCTKALMSRLRYVKTMVERMMSSSNSRPGSISTARLPSNAGGSQNTRPQFHV